MLDAHEITTVRCCRKYNIENANFIFLLFPSVPFQCFWNILALVFGVTIYHHLLCYDVFQVLKKMCFLNASLPIFRKLILKCKIMLYIEKYIFMSS